ncbi:GNAT family N-acetyltransferase [Paenibacillus marinisediminis]
MTPQIAAEISNWTYEAPYSMYSMDGDQESIDEFLNGDYFYVLNEKDDLIGFVCAGESARAPGGYAQGVYEDDRYLDLGLGMKPKLTGSGQGYDFMMNGISFMQNHFKVSNLRLIVATFNERAIKVYERAGFVKGISFFSPVSGQPIEFIEMKRFDVGTGGMA